MLSNWLVEFSEAQAAELESLVAAFEHADAALAAAEADRAQALARAGQLAREIGAGKRAEVREHEMALRGIAATIGVQARVSDRSMQHQIGEATRLAERFPATLAARGRNEITRQHVRAITDAASPLPDDVAAVFEVEALEQCRRDTNGRVRARLEILAQRLHPRTFTERHQDARAHRGVFISPLPDGMSSLCLIAPTPLIAGIDDRLTQMAVAVTDARDAARGDARDAARGPVLCGGPDPDDATVSSRADDTDPRVSGTAWATDTRTRDQLRADIATDILLSGSPLADPTLPGDGPGALGMIRAKLQVVVPALNLLRPDARHHGASGAADLVGYSPIDPATARHLAGSSPSWWERLVTHPVTGQLLHTDTYQRTAAIDRFLRARDQHCRFPGCRIPAIRCEVDHTVDYALGGATTIANLSHLCQRHHSMKQFSAWKVRQLDHGVLEWTSPLGRTYTDTPPTPTVHFHPDD